ncbi:NAD(P)-dependent oxidoreductase [Variovorax rhizosphaerae]|uniref:NAD(P)-dependent oxidoreductase n=1 Tax=Variovorax rhizosphaerae TaxID=1836200 RepID=A0ABU8WHU9_9BURK
MRIAVTGASGFIGRHVLQALVSRKGVEAIAVSRTAPGDWLPLGVRQVALDMAALPTDPFDVIGRPDAVIHLAWGGLPNYMSRGHYEVQLPLQYRFLQRLVDGGLSSLICTGTCLEYGMRSGELQEFLPTDPRNPYGFAKDALRRQLEFLAVERGLRLGWARLFYMYGDGQAAGSLYSQFLAAGAAGASEFPMSGGEQLRDFLHVAEVARSLVALACDAPGPWVVNVCSGRPTSVRRLVEGWLEERGWSMKLALGRYPYPNYEPMAFWGSNARLTQLLGRA